MLRHLSVALFALAGLAFNPLARGDSLYVASLNSSAEPSDAGTVGEYDATTGAAIGGFTPITGLVGPIGLALYGGDLYVASYYSGIVGQYNATTGATINASFITGPNYPFYNLAVSGSNLYVADFNNNKVGEYNAASGATINASLITGLGEPVGLAFSGSNLYVANFTSNTVGEYNAVSGAAINANFITGLTGPTDLVLSGNNLYVGNQASFSLDNSWVGEYNATTGAVVNSRLITGLEEPEALALDGNNLYVLDAGSPSNYGILGEYNATTGAAINADLISGPSGGLNGPDGLVIAVTTPEPSTFALLGAGAIGLVGYSLLRRRKGLRSASREPFGLAKLRQAFSTGSGPLILGQATYRIVGVVPSPAEPFENARISEQEGVHGSRFGAIHP